MTIIETDRLILRLWQSSDIEPFCALNADERVMEYYPRLYDRQHSIRSVKKYQQQYDEHGYTLYAVELKKTGQFIGYVGLMDVEDYRHFAPAVEIGWRLAYEYWGNGYATEAATAVLAYAFDELGLKEVVSFTARLNKRSIRVMEKLGLKYSPKDDFMSPGLPKDHELAPHVLYWITRDEYLRQSA